MLLYLLLSVPSLALSLPGVPWGAKIVLAIFAPCGFAQGLQLMVKSEQQRIGVTWSNVADPNLAGGGISLLALTCMLALDVVLYTLAAYYLDAVVPTEFGVPRHPLFCCGRRYPGGAAGGVAGIAEVEAARAFARGDFASHKQSGDRLHILAYCFRRRQGYNSVPQSQLATAERWFAVTRARQGSSDGAATSMPLVNDSAVDVTTLVTGFQQVETPLTLNIAQRLAAAAGTGGDVEDVPAVVQARGGVHVRGLCKVFHGAEGPRLALDDLTVSMYAGQCTAILGHNGAGKSTLQRIMAGLYGPTTGFVEISGEGGNMSGTIGYCPQHDDALFSELTVTEHLALFGGIKGSFGAALDADISSLIAELGLGEKRDAFASTLSEGQKRRLSIAIALIGSPKGAQHRVLYGTETRLVEVLCMRAKFLYVHMSTLQY